MEKKEGTGYWRISANITPRRIGGSFFKHRTGESESLAKGEQELLTINLLGIFSHILNTRTNHAAQSVHKVNRDT